MTEEMTLEEFRAELAKKKPHKYGAKKTEVDGFLFSSWGEAKRYSELKLLEKANEIKNMELQPRFPCMVNGVLVCDYFADFRYFDNSKKEIVIEDFKGMRTPVFKLKKRLVEALYKIKITEVT